MPVLNYGIVKAKIQEGVPHYFLWSMQDIQQRNNSPSKNPATLLQLSPGLHRHPHIFSSSHYLLLTAWGKKINGTKHIEQKGWLKYLIMYVHIGTWNTKQHSNVNITIFYTQGKTNKQAKVTTEWHLFLFMYWKQLGIILSTARYYKFCRTPVIDEMSSIWDVYSTGGWTRLSLKRVLLTQFFCDSVVSPSELSVCQWRSVTQNHYFRAVLEAHPHRRWIAFYENFSSTVKSVWVTQTELSKAWEDEPLPVFPNCQHRLYFTKLGTQRRTQKRCCGHPQKMDSYGRDIEWEIKFSHNPMGCVRKLWCNKPTDIFFP